MQNSITIITDASFCSKTLAAGYGVWIASEQGKKAFEGPLPKPRDNNVAETMAIANALWHGCDSGIIQSGAIILIQTDSANAISSLKGIIHPTCQQVRDAVCYVERIKQRFSLVLRYKHVRGHTKNADSRSRAQNHCDAAAKRQMLIVRDEICKLNPDAMLASAKKKRNSTNYLRSRKRNSNG